MHDGIYNSSGTLSISDGIFSTQLSKHLTKPFFKESGIEIMLSTVFSGYIIRNQSRKKANLFIFRNRPSFLPRTFEDLFFVLI